MEQEVSIGGVIILERSRESHKTRVTSVGRKYYKVAGRPDYLFSLETYRAKDDCNLSATPRSVYIDAWLSREITRVLRGRTLSFAVLKELLAQESDMRHAAEEALSEIPDI